MLQVVDKERNLYCQLLTDFASCFRVSAADFEYLFAGQGILGLKQQCFLFYIFSSKQTHAQSQ